MRGITRLIATAVGAASFMDLGTATMPVKPTTGSEATAIRSPMHGARCAMKKSISTRVLLAAVSTLMTLGHHGLSTLARILACEVCQVPARQRQPYRRDLGLY